MSDAAVKRALAEYGEHPWNATSRLCKCGEHFPATLVGHRLHDEHRMEATLKAAQEEVFCDQCAGPYEGWLMEQYGGHWDTCPNRAKAILPDDKGGNDT